MKESPKNQIQQKQKYLRSQILDSGVDPESFMVFMGAFKGEGDNINLQNWTLPELKNVVQEFKRSWQQQIKRQQNKQSKLSAEEALQRNRSSREVVDRVMGSKLPKKQKIFYQRDDLWDYEMKNNIDCKKAHTFFDLKNYPEVTCKSVEVKKVGGYIFGIGAKNSIQITISPNFSSSSIPRKSQDADWLRQTLVLNYPGSYVPPLQETPVFQPEDKAAISKRARQIMQFLNSLVHFDYLLNNKYSHMFLTESDYKAFENFKSKNVSNQIIGNPQTFESSLGYFPIQISQRIQQIVKYSSKFSKQSVPILKGIQQNLSKLHQDYGKLTRHYTNLSNDFGKLREKYVALSQKCAFDKSEENIQFDKKLAAVLGHLRIVFNNLEGHAKRQAQMIRQFNQQNVKVMIKEWNQFDLLEKRHKRELQAYLTLKLSLSKKKQQFFLDISKKQLEQRQKNGSTKQTTLSQKQDIYKQKFPQQTKIEEEKRSWQGYINHMYQKSFLALLSEQQKQIERRMRKAYPLLASMLNQTLEKYNGFPKYLQQQQKASHS